MAPPKAKKSTKGKPRNFELSAGIMRFSKARMFGKKAIHLKMKLRTPAPAKPTTERFVVKKIGGEKNGGERKVLIKKPKALMDPERIRVKKAHKKPVLHKNHIRRLRPSITPGTILIVLVGPHKGKRVVFLKQLESGLLLVTGPHMLNGYPLRRINKIYVIATKTKIDLTGVEIPETLNDTYFSRVKKHNKKANAADIFSTKKKEYVVSEQRKKDQKLVDGMILSALKKRDDKTFIRQYLRTLFQLRKNEYPHNIVF